MSLASKTTTVMLAITLTLPTIARTHERSISHAHVTTTADSTTITLRITNHDRREPAERLVRAVELSDEHGACALEAGSFTELVSSPGSSRFEWRVRCDGTPGTLRALPVSSRPGHLCFATVRTEGVESDHVLSELAPEAVLAAAGAEPSTTPPFLRFVPIGIEHILTGLDHVVFLAMLLLLARSLRETALVVTGFTLGHSVTLGAAALELVRTDVPLVEALIGLSVALVAVENAWHVRDRPGRTLPIVAVTAVAGVALTTRSLAVAGVALFAACYFALIARSMEGRDPASDTAGAPGPRPLRGRLALAALFGLLHGLGFAGALRGGGLPPADAVAALLGFNAGVEIGQLAIVAFAFPALLWLRARSALATRLTVDLVSAAGLAAGTFWLVSRLP